MLMAVLLKVVLMVAMTPTVLTMARRVSASKSQRCVGGAALTRESFVAR